MDQYRVIATRKGAAVVHRIGYLWADRYLEDLAVCRRPNTVRAYAFDLARWLNHCVEHRLEPLQLSPRDVLHFIEAERSDGRKVNERTISRRLSAIRQWYGYLALHPEQTGVTRNPITATGVLGTALGARRKQPSPLRYDRPLPQVLSSEEITHFLEHLTVTTYRDRAIVYLMWHAGLRISEALALQLGDIDWGSRLIVVRAGKSRRERRILIHGR